MSDNQELLLLNCFFVCLRNIKAERLLHPTHPSGLGGKGNAPLTNISKLYFVTHQMID